ncbi:MAG: monovalent cation/H(+) antiporter subunit G [Acidiphilium sp.]
MRVAIDAVLGVMVLSVWLGCAGFVRLRTPLDRMHCVAFVNVVAGGALILVAFLADGPSNRAFKIVLVEGLALLSGAAMAHATGRALAERGQPAAEPSGRAPEG